MAWAGLYKVRSGGTRLDFLPFLVIYVALVAGVFAPPSSQEAGEKQDSSSGSSSSNDGGIAPLWVLVAWPLVLLAHLLTHLSTHWSVACDAAVSYARVSTAREATHVRVRPLPNSGSEEMVPLLRVDEEARDVAGVPLDVCVDPEEPVGFVFAIPEVGDDVSGAVDVAVVREGDAAGDDAVDGNGAVGLAEVGQGLAGAGADRVVVIFS